MMTVTFVSRDGKALAKESMGFAPPVGSVIDLQGCAGVVESVKFVNGPCGIEAQALLAGQPAIATGTIPLSEQDAKELSTEKPKTQKPKGK